MDQQTYDQNRKTLDDLKAEIVGVPSDKLLRMHNRASTSTFGDVHMEIIAFYVRRELMRRGFNPNGDL
jgi:hypothetical protein